MENLFSDPTTIPVILVGWGAVMGLLHSRSRGTR